MTTQAALRRAYPSMFDKPPKVPRGRPLEERVYPTTPTRSAAENPKRKATRETAFALKAYPSLQHRYDLWVEGDPRNADDPGLMYLVKEKR